MAAEVPRQAWLVAADATSFRAGMAAIWAVGRHYGASHLSPDLLTDLDEWIAETLLAAIPRAEADIAARQAVLAELRGENPVRYYARLAGGDEGLQWAFAAISPPYRASLLAARRR
jgi:hypothetical protein